MASDRTPPTNSIAEYRFCKFEDVDFSRITIEQCHFTSCTFNNSDFSGARLVKCKFVSCSFNAPNFAGANLSSDFEDCIIEDANCTNTIVTNMVFSGGRFKQSIPEYSGSASDDSDFELPTPSRPAKRPAPDQIPARKECDGWRRCQTCRRRMTLRNYDLHLSAHAELGYSCRATLGGCPLCGYEGHGMEKIILHLRKCVRDSEDAIMGYQSAATDDEE